MHNALYSLASIVVCLLLGYALHFIAGGLPPSLYGMIILTTLLTLKIIKVDKLTTTVQWIIANMGVCFVPAAIGIIEYVALIKEFGLIITVIVVSTSLLLMALVGFLYQHFIDNKHSQP